jgi:hypothetical protein
MTSSVSINFHEEAIISQRNVVAAGNAFGTKTIAFIRSAMGPNSKVYIL